MVTVQEIIDTKSKELLDKARTLEFVLYEKEGTKVNHQFTSFRETTEVYERLTPLAYSSNKAELEEYIKNNNVKHYEITKSPFVS